VNQNSKLKFIEPTNATGQTETFFVYRIYFYLKIKWLNKFHNLYCTYNITVIVYLFKKPNIICIVIVGKVNHAIRIKNWLIVSEPRERLVTLENATRLGPTLFVWLHDLIVGRLLGQVNIGQFGISEKVWDFARFSFGVLNKNPNYFGHEP